MMNIRKFLVFLAVTCSFVNCSDLDVEKDCARNEKCVDQKLSSIIDRIDSEERIPLIGGLDIIRTVENEPVNVGRGDESLFERMLRFMGNHDILFSDQDEPTERGFEAEARSSRLKKLLLPLLLVLKLKMAIVLPIVLSFIKLIAIKGLFAGLTAIMISGATALKSLGDSKPSKLAILATPVSDNYHGQDYHWGRLGQDPASLNPQSIGAYPQQPSVEQYSPYAAYQGMQQLSQLSPQ